MRPIPDRRRSPRRTVEGTALGAARLVGGGPVRVVDLSRHGAALAGYGRTRLGRVVALSWQVPAEPVRVPARVVRAWVRALHGEAGVEYGAGVEFTAPADALWELTTRSG
jgi:hypothetical protein